MKAISYSLFESPSAGPLEKAAYVRGFYWNSRMNRLIYPDSHWRTVLHLEHPIYIEFQRLFDWLVDNNNLILNVTNQKPALCEGMFWRMKPIFGLYTHVLCRDSDAVTTYREAQAVQRWLESGLACHSINDNPAHSGMMGGMVGFNTAQFKALLGVHSYEDLIQGYDLSQRGSDQNLMNQRIFPKLQWSMMAHNTSNLPDLEGKNYPPLPLVEEKYWQSNLTCRHIGSAGVVDMEMVRFFRNCDIFNWKFEVIEKEFPKLFHWWL